MNAESTQPEKPAAAPPDEKYREVRYRHSRDFARIVAELGVSLLVSTYQAGQWVLLRADGDTINTHFMGMQKPMGAAFSNGRLALGFGLRVWDYRAMPMVAPMTT